MTKPNSYMQISKTVIDEKYVTKFIAEENGKTVGRAFLYLIYNDLHKEPYGLLEDVFVDEVYRGKGVGTLLIKAIIEEAKARRCVKIRFTSRRIREDAHKWYEKLGFEKYGYAFKMDL